jgi:hypothetical protein
MARLIGIRRSALAAVLLAALLAAACGGSGPSMAPAGTGGQSPPARSAAVPSAAGGATPTAVAVATPSAAATHVPLTSLPVYEPGSLAKRDADGDGTAETYDYSFPTENLTDDLTLDRTLTTTAGDDALRSILELRFENHGMGRIDYTYRLEIPKEIAASINDIAFSVPPTRVIDPDPLAEWDLDLEKAAGAVIMLTVGTASEDFVLTPGPVGVIIVTRIAACKALPDEQRAACVLELVREFRDIGSLEEGLEAWIAKTFPGICERLPATPETAFSRAACLALLQGASACAGVSDPGERALCHAYLAEADCALTRAGAPRDTCLFERAIAGSSTFACALIDGADARALCEAGVTKSEDACRRLSTQDMVDRCLGALAKGETPTMALIKPPVEDVDPDWFPVAAQDGPCKILGAGLAGWKMGTAKNRTLSGLDCWFEAQKPERTKNIGIRVFPSEKEAQAAFAKCCSESPPGTNVPQPAEGVEEAAAWNGDRFARGLGFVFAALNGGAWVEGRWSDEHLVIERYRNCLIGIMTNIDYDAPPLKAPEPPPLTADVDAETEAVIEAAKAVIDTHLE